MNKFTNTPTEIDNYVEILKKQLYFAVLKGKTSLKLKNNLNTFFFSTDDELVYENYYSDFGPLNISCLFKFCVKLRKYLQYAKGLKSVVYYTSDHPDKKANAACLIGLFSVIYLNFQPKDIWRALSELGPYKPYLDASQYPGGFTLKIPDCILAIQKALSFNFFNFDDFNVTEYDLYDKLQYGDMNWLVPRKFLAFIGPSDNKTAHPPEFYIKYFLKNDVKTVIRLNSIIYNSEVFTQVGIQHFDLIFPDGTTPPKDILLKFLAIAEMAPAAIAVHCKAGLGRTGSLIGAYLIKHYCLTAREAIAWMRLCRPGSVIGQQQVWLEKLENWLWKVGSQYRIKKYGSDDKIPRHKYGIYSREWPLERERIIVEARRKIQKSFTKSQLEKISKQKRYSASMDSFSKNSKQQKAVKKLGPNEIIPYKSVSKFISSFHGPNRDPAPSNMSSIVQINRLQPKISNYPKSEYAEEKVTNHLKLREKQDTKNVTQGDKLNEIKASWLNSRNLRAESLKHPSQNERYRKFHHVPN
nr:dual specificity protein phosphatase CDC14B-like [Leptinotarsa decemlineata]